MSEKADCEGPLAIAQANAHLIAAAPELLEACQDLWRVVNALKPLGKYTGAAEALEKATAAIAKAKGN
jgi:diketogulonate reductase-like aldo/keto reductase